MTTLKLIVACPLPLVMVTSARTEERLALPTPTTASASMAGTEVGRGEGPFVGVVRGDTGRRPSASDGVYAEKEAEPDGLTRIVAIEHVCAWPNLTLLPDGTVAAVIHNQPSHGGREGDVDCWASTDAMKWEKRGTVARHEPNTVRMNVAAGLARNGDLVVLCSGWTNEKQPDRPKQPPFRDAVLRSWGCRSCDGGRTWETRTALPPPQDGWTEYIPFGDIWVSADGSLRVSCYQREFSDSLTASKTRRYRSWHFRSDDDGRTWKPLCVIGPRHNETDLFLLGGRTWLAAARLDAVELFRSDDDGRTWRGPQPVTNRNEINGHLLRLKDGRVLLCYGVRVPGHQGVCAKISGDEGRTWGATIRLARSLDSDCGYPSSAQRADGRVVTAYYSKRARECEHYHMGVAIWDVPPH